MVSSVIYKSSVLKETFGSDDCPVCKFIEGDRSHETLMGVIRLLDLYLAKEEANVSIDEFVKRVVANMEATL